MLKPTQDKELREDISAYIYRCFGTWKEYSYYDLSGMNKAGWRTYADEILDKLEKLGYYKGLPTSIEEALNSGDGVYRP